MIKHWHYEVHYHPYLKKTSDTKAMKQAKHKFGLAAEGVEQVGTAADQHVVLSMCFSVIFGQETFLLFWVNLWYLFYRYQQFRNIPALSWTENPLWTVEAGQGGHWTRLGHDYNVDVDDLDHQDEMQVVVTTLTHLPTRSTVGEPGLRKEAAGHWILLVCQHWHIVLNWFIVVCTRLCIVIFITFPL